jgi:hypothetical protein
MANMTAHADSHTLPTIPFTEAEKSALRLEDVSAAKLIACLTTGIFACGFVLYVLVLISSGVQELFYLSTR